MLEVKSEKRKVKSLRCAPCGRGENFPMIGKLFSNGWKTSPGFSNDWKKSFQWLENSGRFFQRLEKFFGGFPMIGKNFRGKGCARGAQGTTQRTQRGRRKERKGRDWKSHPPGWEMRHPAAFPCKGYRRMAQGAVTVRSLKARQRQSPKGSG